MKDETLVSRREQLYRLLPKLYQVLDAEDCAAEQRGPLRELLSIIGEQINLLEDDLARWYDNWFIETCEEWLVPYLGDLVGYESAARELDTEDDPESPLNRAVVFPRREVADTIAFRRRKGTLAILEELSRRIVGWPARAVEYRRFTAGTAALNHLRARRSGLVDVHDGRSLSRLDTPFDRLPRTVDVRRVNSRRTPSRHNVPAVGLFVYRRKIDSATLVPTRAVNRSQRKFDIQGLDIALHVLPQPEPASHTIARLRNLPVPLTRSLLRRRLSRRERQLHDTAHPVIGANPRFYGVGKSVFIVVKQGQQRQIVPAANIVVADLSHWNFAAPAHQRQLVALDPELGRLAFHPDHAPDAAWTAYHYGRAAHIGGGEYHRPLSDIPVAMTVVRDAYDKQQRRKLTEAMVEWTASTVDPGHTVVEIADNEEYSAEFATTVPAGHTLEIRAANHYRPYLRVPDSSGQQVEQCRISGEPGSRLILDGLLFGEGELQLDGQFESVWIRHCTFVPGRSRIVMKLNETAVHIQKCIAGEFVTRAPAVPAAPRRESADQENHDTSAYDEPIRLCVEDSILDGEQCEYVLSGADRNAHARLSVLRSTVFGQVATKIVALIQDSILTNHVCVENVLTGCLRFSYIHPDACTPPQFHCQPALAIERALAGTAVSATEQEPLRDQVSLSVAPRFVSRQYGHPDYARLSDDCPVEIQMGAADEGEMGVYHDEFFSQRAVHLRQRLQEFVPAGSDAQLIFAT
jgi:hypothetical protein